jgi:hypothetical protein
MKESDRRSARRTSTGVAFAEHTRLRSVILSGGATAVIMTLKAPANDSRAFPGLCLPFRNGTYVTVVSGNVDITLEVD